MEEIKALPITKLEVKERASRMSRGPEIPSTIAMVERQARVVRLVNPIFPEAARKAGLYGDVMVSVLINKKGKPVQAKVLKSTNGAFNDAAIEAVMQSEYSARVLASGPVASWLTVPFSFKLKGN